MSLETSIEWTDATWNPVTGCTKVSAGCKHCYAETVAGRFWAKQYPPNADGSPRRFTDVRCHPERLEEPLRWRKPRRVFVNSMSDLFHEDVPDEFIAAVFGVMAACPQHTFQALTKRPERMLEWFRQSALDVIDPGRPHYWLRHSAAAYLGDGSEADLDRWCDRLWDLGGPEADAPWPLPNVWLGVSCEDQPRADERIPLLLQTPAAVRFVSLEPLLGPITLRFLQPGDPPTEIDALAGTHGVLRPHRGTCDRLNWVIVGGESGPGARPCDLAWIRSIVQQCREAGAACFVKQLGAKPYEVTSDKEYPGRNVHRVTIRRNLKVTSNGGAPAEWPEDLRVREFPGAVL